MKKVWNADEKLQYERALLAKGLQYIAGVDEVGRGPLAGSVVCAAVIMPLDEGSIIVGVDDSKKLSAKKREALAEEIKNKALAYTIVEVSEKEIDKINILEATKLGMKKALETLEIEPQSVLTDGNMTLDITYPQRSVIGGDALSYSIGAASIIAKVYRDKMMDEYAKEYPQYAFDSNKGYGTAAHIQAIKEYGLCPIHRRTFTKKF
ncbi:MAG: ribonuclease HII [Clostridia bacterium]|nr:ribonuclease HII [Clostridia bacterium]MBP3422407.1 ribonuclease HII [Clostridia bacterium]